MPISEERIRHYLAEVDAIISPVKAAFRRAAEITPSYTVTEDDGSVREIVSITENDGSVRVTVPLTSAAAFEAMTVGFTVWAKRHRDARSSGRLIRDDVFDPPGFQPDDWLALGQVVGADPQDAGTPEGRNRIATCAVAAVQRQNLESNAPLKEMQSGKLNESVFIIRGTAIQLTPDMVTTLEYAFKDGGSSLKEYMQKEGVAIESNVATKITRLNKKLKTELKRAHATFSVAVSRKCNRIVVEILGTTK